MPLTSSGQIDLNAMHVEAGGTSGTECTLNDADIRGLISKGAAAQSAFNEFYGASAVSTYTLTGTSFKQQSTQAKAETPRYIEWRYANTTGTANTVFEDNLTNYSTLPGYAVASDRYVIFRLYDYFNYSSFAQTPARLEFLWQDLSPNSALVLPQGLAAASSTMTAANTNNYFEFYYNGTLIGTYDTWWTSSYSTGASAPMINDVGNNTSASSLVGSRTTASSWTMKAFIY